MVSGATMTSMIRVTISLKETIELWQDFMDECKKRRTTASEEIRKFIVERLKEFKKEKLK